MELEKRITVRMPVKDHARLIEEAKMAKMGFSEYIRKLLSIKG